MLDFKVYSMEALYINSVGEKCNLQNTTNCGGDKFSLVILYTDNSVAQQIYVMLFYKVDEVWRV